MFLDPDRPIDRRWRNLPHWQQEGTFTFVTFRLADSISAPAMKRWREDRGRWLEARGLPATEDLSESLARLSADQRRVYLREFGRRFHELLDSGHGSCLLRNPAHSEVVATALECFDGQRYELGDYVVMPNHVHVLVAPREGYSLSAILHSWKRFSAREINRRAGRRASFGSTRVSITWCAVRDRWRASCGIFGRIR